MPEENRVRRLLDLELIGLNYSVPRESLVVFLQALRDVIPCSDEYQRPALHLKALQKQLWERCEDLSNRQPPERLLSEKDKRVVHVLQRALWDFPE